MSEIDLSPLRPYWYPVGPSSEIGSEPAAVTIRAADTVSLRYRRALAAIGARYA